MSRIAQVSATGDISAAGAGSNPRRLYSVAFTAGAVNSAVEVRDGSGGAIVLTLKRATAGESVVWTSGSRDGIPFSSSIHATLTGAASVASFEFD